MIQRKKKICKCCGLEKYLFGKGFCQMCYNFRVAKPIKKISDKHKETLRDYKKVRIEYLTQNPTCKARLKNCTVIATEVHHLIGKTNREKYLDVNNFMSVCRGCHQQIEDGGIWVYERGFKINRI